MRFVPGDPNKHSLTARGLDFETIVQEITTNGVKMTYRNPQYPGQIVVVAEILGYTHCIACEPVRDGWRIITAWPSRKYHHTQ